MEYYRQYFDFKSWKSLEKIPGNSLGKRRKILECCQSGNVTSRVFCTVSLDHKYDEEWFPVLSPLIDSDGSKGGAPGPPLRPKNFSISCSFLENLAKSYVGTPPSPGELASPPTGNPGSTPDRGILKEVVIGDGFHCTAWTRFETRCCKIRNNVVEFKKGNKNYKSPLPLLAINLKCNQVFFL